MTSSAKKYKALVAKQQAREKFPDDGNIYNVSFKLVFEKLLVPKRTACHSTSIEVIFSDVARGPRSNRFLDQHSKFPVELTGTDTTVSSQHHIPEKYPHDCSSLELGSSPSLSSFLS